MARIDRNKWTWMPHPAHFIASDHCQFHLATDLGNGILVSTIGEYWPERVVRDIHAQIHDSDWWSANRHLLGDEYDHEYKQHFGFEDLGGRTYETMVFKSVPDIWNKCRSCPFMISSGYNYDFIGYNTGNDAYKGHLATCKKYATMIVKNLEAE